MQKLQWAVRRQALSTALCQVREKDNFLHSDVPWISVPSQTQHLSVRGELASHLQRTYAAVLPCRGTLLQGGWWLLSAQRGWLHPEPSSHCWWIPSHWYWRAEKIKVSWCLSGVTISFYTFQANTNVCSTPWWVTAGTNLIRQLCEIIALRTYMDINKKIKKKNKKQKKQKLPSKAKFLHGICQPIESLCLVFGVLLCKCHRHNLMYKTNCVITVHSSI